MTNFEEYVNSLTQDKFIDSMILNCDGCPVYPCCEDGTEDNGVDCEERLRDWCDDVARFVQVYKYDYRINKQLY